MSGVTVTVQIDSIQAERTSQLFPAEDLFFDINAKLEENKKNTNQVAVGFNLMISTKPSIVKYIIDGTVTLDGPPTEIKKKLEPNPKTKIPQILFTVYQLVFNAIYMLAGVLNTPYPPPDLLHPMAEKIKILPETKESTAAPAAPGGQQQAQAAPAPEKQTTAEPSLITTPTPTSPPISENKEAPKPA